MSNEICEIYTNIYSLKNMLQSPVVGILKWQIFLAKRGKFLAALLPELSCISSAEHQSFLRLQVACTTMAEQFKHWMQQTVVIYWPWVALVTIYDWPVFCDHI